MRECGIGIPSPILYIHLRLMTAHSGPLKATILLGEQMQPSLYSKQRCKSVKQDCIWCPWTEYCLINSWHTAVLSLRL